MDVLGHLVARARLDSPSVLDAAGTPPRTYDYHRFCTSAWRTGNFLRHLGVREGTTVAIADEPVPESILTLLGATLLGATVRFDPPRRPECRVVVAPTQRVTDYGLPRGGKRVGYGTRPDDPTISHFETEMWSENPTFPETDVVADDDPALATPARTYSHHDLLVAASRIVDDHDLTADARVTVRAPFAHPGTVVAGILAPLSVGATIVLSDGTGEALHGDVAVTEAGGRGPEPRTITVDGVRLD